MTCVLKLNAQFECYGCGRAFWVELDPNEVEAGRHNIAEYMTEMVDSGHAFRYHVRGKQTVDRTDTGGLSSVQDGRLLCGECTKKCDSLTDENGAEITRALTAQEVDRALNKSSS